MTREDALGLLAKHWVDLKPIPVKDRRRIEAASLPGEPVYLTVARLAGVRDEIEALVRDRITTQGIAEVIHRAMGTQMTQPLS